MVAVHEFGLQYHFFEIFDFNYFVQNKVTKIKSRQFNSLWLNSAQPSTASSNRACFPLNFTYSSYHIALNWERKTKLEFRGLVFSVDSYALCWRFKFGHTTTNFKNVLSINSKCTYPSYTLTSGVCRKDSYWIQMPSINAELYLGWDICFYVKVG